MQRNGNERYPASLPTERFTDRVDNYVRWRPSYPAELIDHLKNCGVLTGGTVVADIGAGTGIFSRLLVPPAARVYAVEPNDAMRSAAGRQDQPAIVHVKGTAEETTLPDGSVDVIAAAQAFHWFEPAAARAEFARILKPGGRVALIWNERLPDATPFLRDYEALLQTKGTDYGAVNHTRIDREAIARFFMPAGFGEFRFPCRQSFDREGLIGRTLSSSYVPGPDHPGHAEFFRELEALFHRHATAGRVEFLYSTVLYLGDPGAPARDAA